MTTCPSPRALWLGPGKPPLATCCRAHMLRPVVFTYAPAVAPAPNGGAR